MTRAVGAVLLACVVVLLAPGRSAPQDGDPTPEMIEKTMGPNDDTVEMGGPTVKVRLEGTEVPAGGKCRFYVEMHNERSRNLLAYIPGLIGRVDYRPEDGRPAVPLGDFACGAYLDPRKNFVVLAPGAYYGLCHEVETHLPGTVRVSVRYANKDDGKKFGLPAWVGETAAVESPIVKIVATK